MDVGPVTIIYTDVEGKVKPTQTSATIEEGKLATVNATYTNPTGTVKVVITGDGGAGRWRLSTESSSTAHQSNETATAEVGSVIIVYTDVDGKTKPTQTTATVQAGKTVTVNAEYTTPSTGG